MNSIQRLKKISEEKKKKKNHYDFKLTKYDWPPRQANKDFDLQVTPSGQTDLNLLSCMALLIHFILNIKSMIFVY